MNKPRIRQQFKFYRTEYRRLKEANKVVDRHHKQDLADLEGRIEDLEKERDFYKNNGHYH